MLPEILVLLACITSKGCSETSSHYYSTHLELREMVESNTKKIEDLAGPTAITVVGPFLYAAVGGTGTVRINKYFNLRISSQGTTLGFTKEF